MQKLHYLFLCTSLLLAVSSCKDKASSFDFDTPSWKKDLYGCNGQRAAMVEKIKTIKPELIGLNEQDIISIFGKPNKEQLSSRGSKTFYYYIDGGQDYCDTNQIPQLLSIDFGALNNVRIITFQRF